jgi:hypothetical protein
MPSTDERGVESASALDAWRQTGEFEGGDSANCVWCGAPCQSPEVEGYSVCIDGEPACMDCAAKALDSDQ